VSQVVTTPPDVEAQSAEVSAEAAESAPVQSELTPTWEPRKKRRKVDEDDASLFMSEKNLLISEIHLIISLHFSFVIKQRTEASKMIVRYVKVIFFCFNIKYSMVFIEYMLWWISNSLCATSHRTR